MIRAALALALLAAPVAAEEAAPDLSDPVKLFEGVCLSDQVKLASSSVADQAYGTLPAGARDALGFANPPGGVPLIGPPFGLAAADVPNRILAILPAKHSYLLLPAEAGRYAGACTVLWKGNHYPDALKAARALAIDAPVKGMPPLNRSVPGLSYAVFTAKGMIVGAAEYGGWTVLRISPDLSSSPEQK